MIKIKLMRKIKGKYLIKEYEEKYGNLKKAKELFEKTPDMLLELDLEEWEYFQEHPEEELEQGHLIYAPQGFSGTDLEILDMIKNEKPESLTELAKLVNKDISTVQRKVNKLKKEGLVELTEGNINNMKTPVFNYDKIEIAI